ncbi:aldose epimerase family protein [Halalkalibacter okhensis]|uniref:Aldose 1-epimerase n=1 Tax=Halalkalibacter okhensis TaxID=333138 RepID=A0A0B0IGB2_9BACI|nr:aldose epimerase family protein [Halalkalibacter okhensis]KHF39114.1 aldose epimerase [Halalkalibacter okhensis]
MKVTKGFFGTLNGKEVTAYTLSNSKGMEMTCLTYGGIITKLLTPDREGKREDVVLGFDRVEDYERNSPYFGAIVGRFAGRIRGAAFELEGKSYQLLKNDGENHLHGGKVGFSHVIWEAETFEEQDRVGVALHYVSQDGEEGYPGNLNVTVTYTLTEENELLVDYAATTDQTTIVNLTNHTYFNLSGDLKEDILDHELTIKSDEFLQLKSDLMPTGEKIRVDGTPFDFNNGKQIKEGATSVYEQNVLAGRGYDHPFMLNTNNDREIMLKDEKSGRVLMIETDEPCVVLYTGTQIEDTYKVKGVQARKYLGLCLETQGAPDSINQPQFPSPILRAGERYESRTRYVFGVE